MDLHKLNCDEMRAWEVGRLSEVETEVRKELADMRMDVYAAATQRTAKKRGLKRTLARVLTVRAELQNKKIKGN